MRFTFRFITLILIIHLLPSPAFSQPAEPPKKEKKHYLYFSWGYNKDWYSKSTIHFKSGSNSDIPYDFEWVKVKAHDRTGFSDIMGTDISIPQYVYRVGYMFNTAKGIGIEFAFDHSKYIVTQEQTFHVKGTINGDYYDEHTNYTADEMHFEHTNGANFAMLNAFKEHICYASLSTNFEVAWLAKAGAGLVIPKTDVALFGERLDNRFHVAGYIIGTEGGLTLNFWHRLFVAPTLKASWANYVNALTVDNGTAQHSFFAYEAILTIGYKARF